jgi:restriction system protein
MSTNKNMWMVRAGEGGYLFEEFKDKNVVAIGWNDVGDLSKVTSLDALKELYRREEAEEEEKEGKINASCGMLRRFKDEIHKGDYVVTYNPESRQYLIGEVTGEYAFNTKLLQYYHTHSVRWHEKVVDRDALSTSTRNSLGAISTIFEVKDEAKEEMLKVLQGNNYAPEVDQQEDVVGDTLKDDIANRAQESIKDKVVKLDWEEMQQLVAGLLRGMGYKTMVSPKGPDRGRDVQASPDGLGLEDPKIIVQVKHRSGQMGSEVVRSFITSVGHSAKGLYVSTGGFSKDARLEAERSQTPVTLVDIDLLVSLLIQYYDMLDSDTRALLPLVKIYWPA